MTKNIKPVILCGGAGQRLWPESRETKPKQFISVIRGYSLLELTLTRAMKIKNISNPIIVTHYNYRFFVYETLEKLGINATIILEPIGKNTTASIYIASKLTRGNAELIIMPSDHYITQEDKFIKEINNIIVKKKSLQLITLGIKPTYPSTAYGYIKLKKLANKKIITRVDSFIEKPNKTYAEKLIKTDLCYWNAGIFLGTRNMIINSIKEHSYKTSKYCDQVIDKGSSYSKLKNEYKFNFQLFNKIPSISIDYSVMEKSKNVFCSLLSSKWSDIGSWDSYATTFQKKSNKNKIFEIESNNNFIKTSDRLIATIGVHDHIIIDNKDATLFVKKGSSEDVKKLVNELQSKKIVEAKTHPFENRPWGNFEVLLDNKFCKVKIITVLPNSRLSKQYHNFRSEHWIITKGKGRVFLDNKFLNVKKGQSIDIPQKSIHYIENNSNNNLIFIEVQMGTYFGEDDIIRLEDIYDRE